MTLRLWSCLTVLLVNLIVGDTDGLNVPKSPSRACVVGAGYSGLGTARYLQEYGVNFTVFEATRHVGGTWRFDPYVGTDEDGLPLFTSMYKYLRTNTPRQVMEYEGFPFPESTPSYPTATCFHKYLKHFTQKFGLEKYMQFQSYVTSIKWAGDHWNITYTNTDKRTDHTEACDYVIVATGELTKPVWPHFEGLESFKGKVIHSHDYKEPEPYINRRVLLVGAGPSGLDLAMQLSNVTSRLVHSHHLEYNQPYFGSGYVKKPDIKSFSSNGVVFQDDSFEEIDDVILCTGYDFEHPFLDESAGITKSGKYLLPLYQHIVNIRHPSMMFVGVSKKIINKVLAAQGHYAAALVANKFQLPSQDEMLQSWLDHAYTLEAKGMKIIHINVVGTDMIPYLERLSKEAGVPLVPPVMAAIRDFNAKNRLEDLLNYREYDYKILSDTKFDRWYNPKKGNPCPIED